MLERGYTALRPQDPNLGNKVETVFTIPYARSEVYAASIRVASPVGTEPVRFEVVGEHPNPTSEDELAVGLQRKAHLPGGERGRSQTSKIMTLVKDTYISYQQTSSDIETGPFAFEDQPLTSILLADAIDGSGLTYGTTVRVRVDFTRTKNATGGVAAWLMPCLPRVNPADPAEALSPSQMTSKWSRSMADRGYTPMVPTKLASSTKAAAADAALSKATAAAHNGTAPVDASTSPTADQPPAIASSMVAASALVSPSVVAPIASLPIAPATAPVTAAANGPASAASTASAPTPVTALAAAAVKTPDAPPVTAINESPFEA